jgi:hypothetical protein
VRKLDLPDPKTIAKFTVKVEEPLPISLIKNKRGLINLSKGLTTHGKPYKVKTGYVPRVSQRNRTATPAPPPAG